MILSSSTGVCHMLQLVSSSRVPVPGCSDVVEKFRGKPVVETVESIRVSYTVVGDASVVLVWVELKSVVVDLFFFGSVVVSSIGWDEDNR